MIDWLKKNFRRLRGVGVRLSALNNATIVMALLVSTALIYATYQSIEGYQNLHSATARYINCQRDALYFREGSDLLTNESRYFAMTGDPKHAHLFVEEVEVTRRRERMLEDIDDFWQEEKAYNYLKQALQYSNNLVEVECYAMRLFADVYGCDPSDLPERVASIELTPGDAALSLEKKHEKATELLYGTSYLESKENIYASVEKSINALVEDTRLEQERSDAWLSRVLTRQRLLIVLLLMMLFAAVLCTYLLVIRPLKRGVEHIRAHQLIPVTGSYEMQFLASTYNDMFEQHTRRTEKLAFSATHDAVTGLYNRAAFDSMRKSIDETTVGVLIVDIDKFKSYNDRYGHDVGDRVLRRVAQVLRDSFRSEDFVGRIGGDEFCVVMMHVNSRMRDLVYGKVQRANEILQHPEDDLPSVSLSVGVAFGDRENPQGDIFKDADTALYVVKRKEGGNCAFFEP